VVELFTAAGFADGRRGGLFIRRTPVLPVARQKLPTPAALNELAQPRKPEPHGRDFLMDRTQPWLRDPPSHPLCVPLVSRHRSSPPSADLLHRRGLVLRRGWSASPAFSHEYWIERRDYSDAKSLLPYRGSVRLPGLRRRASIELGEHVSAYPARRASAMGSRQSSRSLSSVDETEISGPAAPNRKRQPTMLIPGAIACRGSHGCVEYQPTTAADREKPATLIWIAYFAVFSKLCYATSRE